MNPLDRCTDCEEIELARVRDQVPSQTLPLPAAALAGFPEGRDRAGLTRRRLMSTGLAGVASVYGSRMLGFDEVFESLAMADTVPAQNCLVMVYLAGGNDGLNTLVPQGSADFASYNLKRPSLARVHGADAGGKVGSRPLMGAAGSELGWANVGLSSAGGGSNGSPDYGFDALYGDGSGGAGSDLAIMPAVDYQPPNFSHFASSDYWFNGALSGQTTGWLGRWIDRNGSATNPLQAVSLDSALSKAIRTASNPVCAIQTLGGLGYTLHPSGGYGTDTLGGTAVNTTVTTGDVKALGQVAGAGNPGLQRARSAYSQGADVYGTANALQAQALGSGAAYPSNSTNASNLSYKLKIAAMLLGANVGTRIITIHWGAFDTHGNQLLGQDPQLAELSRALCAFKADLTTRGIEQRVSTMVFSEFGRRVAENGSGTDHGAGGLMMLSGSQVRGGYAAEFPGCQSADLDSYGNLMVPTDFRSVYQSVIDEWLGDDPDAILPGGPFTALTRPDGQPSLFA
ncbi:MAG: hypothetical protein JWM73_2079 [Solirubrobacterales bacterium]|nr:hypothetical protein [Solirubrobacterales bacterium]